MSSRSGTSRSSNNVSRPKPYQREQGASSSKATRQARRTLNPKNDTPAAGATRVIQHYPPLPSGEESQLDILREMVKNKYPLFKPRNSADIVHMAASVYDGPADHATICALIDEHFAEWTPTSRFRDVQEAGEVLGREFDLEIGRTTAKEVLGIKPRQDWEVCIRAMPSCPEYSIRLWASSPSMRQFGMDFIISATGEPVNMSHRFHVYGSGYILGSGSAMRVPPFGKGLTPNARVVPGDESYHFREEQGVTIVDTARKNKRITFKVPKHPAEIPLPNSEEFDVLHFSISK